MATSNLFAALLFIAGAIALALFVGVWRARRAMVELYPAPQQVEIAGLASAVPHGLGRLTAAVLVDHAGTEVSDFLLPYELLAASRAFNVYAVAVDERPAVLTGGLDVVPHLTAVGFDQLPVDRADLVVVPHLPSPDPRAVRWIRHQAEAGATVLSICTGAGVVAAAGLLDGRRATAHWGDLSRFERRFPQVRWQRGVRYVDDGQVAASAGIVSGIDATLHMIRRLAGEEAMHRAADAVGYDDLGYLANPASTQHRLEPADLVLPLRAGFGRRPWIDLVLHDGADETAIAAVLDTYAACFAARIFTVSADGRPVRTRHGLTLIPRGARRPASAVREVLPPADPPYAAIGAALEDLASDAGPALARFAAKRLEHRPAVRPGPQSSEPHHTREESA